MNSFASLVQFTSVLMIVGLPTLVIVGIIALCVLISVLLLYRKKLIKELNNEKES